MVNLLSWLPGGGGKALCGAGRAKPALADTPFLGQAWIPLLAASVCEEADGNGDARLPLLTGMSLPAVCSPLGLQQKVAEMWRKCSHHTSPGGHCHGLLLCSKARLFVGDVAVGACGEQGLHSNKGR